jgi:drug/metabolite transporter (DMT)-like permease
MTKQKMRLGHYVIAVIITIIASLMTVMTSALKIALPDDISTLEVLFYMNIVTAIFFFLYISIKKTPIIYYNFKLVVLRATMGFVGVYLFFFAYELDLSLSAGIVLSKLVPIFSVIGMILIMKEKLMGIQKIILPITLLGAFIGVLIIADPFGGSSNEGILGVLTGVAAGVISGFTMVVIRKLMEKNQPETVGLFNSLFVVSVSFIIMLLTRQFSVLQIESYLLLIAVGFFNTLAVFGMALSTVYASPTKTAPYSYFGVIFAPIVQFILFGTIISGNVAVGGILIVGVNLLNFYLTMKYRKVGQVSIDEEHNEVTTK